jgi:hypothetical protein
MNMGARPAWASGQSRLYDSTRDLLGHYVLRGVVRAAALVSEVVEGLHNQGTVQELAYDRGLFEGKRVDRGKRHGRRGGDLVGVHQTLNSAPIAWCGRAGPECMNGDRRAIGGDH